MIADTRGGKAGRRRWGVIIAAAMAVVIVLVLFPLWWHGFVQDRSGADVHPASGFAAVLIDTPIRYCPNVYCDFEKTLEPRGSVTVTGWTGKKTGLIGHKPDGGPSSGIWLRVTYQSEKDQRTGWIMYDDVELTDVATHITGCC